MTYSVKLHDSVSGETRTYEDDADWDEGYDYMWSDGNYGCDCNRHLFFCRAGGEERDLDAVECGDGRFSVEITSGGKVVYWDGVFDEGNE